jgi:hypothetical protein
MPGQEVIIYPHEGVTLRTGNREFKDGLSRSKRA